MIYNIGAYHGGLGDCLQFSTIPKILAFQGHTVMQYVGPDVYGPRNQEIWDLVWGNNPYIVGRSMDNWNMGDIPGRPYKNTTGSFIKNWEVAMGLPPTNDLPKIYREYNRLSGIEGLIELSSITLKYDIELVKISVRRLMDKTGVRFKQIVSPYQSNPILIEGVDTIKCSCLAHLADLLHSCTHFISLNSGSHALCAGVRSDNPGIRQYCILPTNDYGWIMESQKFIFPGCQYVGEREYI